MFVEMLQFGLILGSVLIIFSISTVFAEEEQVKVLPIYFNQQRKEKEKTLQQKFLQRFL